ncbi:hypothetical protein PPERSA_11760 [Pseudocohnilembus persalinus]|uniref:Uncharacterized protein n=1 Tax=Pseudocohnilembus persalinus TaxID=266149 RepID=A0A0V0QGC2_PSEPJ|nr:hypothetical protein PPERSA_11760 [Pseudocohnilembus persalinus]|eukprot:KRX01313.1 hypothetical protein PPERSA_11760 [Pseudocohnilembus persalinus]
MNFQIEKQTPLKQQEQCLNSDQFISSTHILQLNPQQQYIYDQNKQGNYQNSTNQISNVTNDIVFRNFIQDQQYNNQTKILHNLQQNLNSQVSESNYIPQNCYNNDDYDINQVMNNTELQYDCEIYEENQNMQAIYNNQPCHNKGDILKNQIIQQQNLEPNSFQLFIKDSKIQDNIQEQIQYQQEGNINDYENNDNLIINEQNNNESQCQPDGIQFQAQFQESNVQIHYKSNQSQLNIQNQICLKKQQSEQKFDYSTQSSSKSKNKFQKKPEIPKETQTSHTATNLINALINYLLDFWQKKISCKNSNKISYFKKLSKFKFQEKNEKILNCDCENCKDFKQILQLKQTQKNKKLSDFSNLVKFSKKIRIITEDYLINKVGYYFLQKEFILKNNDVKKSNSNNDGKHMRYVFNALPVFLWGLYNYKNFSSIKN